MLTSMTMLRSCTCHRQRGPTAPFLVQDTFFQTRKSRILMLRLPQIPRSSTNIKRSRSPFLLLLVPPAVDKRRKLRACSPHFLREIKTKLYSSSLTNTLEQSSKGRRR
ncbi:hypothetical protein AXF42_Ash020136 [Apostasia shenzhenica]|uniref:Uncharacterized protein n=1 Tax=Apostasia shenzhenica TaxID=1088818 RepID=A0A2I0A3R4_9ASPA|nr:hypothetical protein AXF42_Ash020136 [Apostasia shenzhenica]